jgi:hypothetical protein
MLFWDLSFYQVYVWLWNLDWPAPLVLNHGSNELHTVVYCRSYLLQFLGWMGVLGCTSFGGVHWLCFAFLVLLFPMFLAREVLLSPQVFGLLACQFGLCAGLRFSDAH